MGLPFNIPSARSLRFAVNLKLTFRGITTADRWLTPMFLNPVRGEPWTVHIFAPPQPLAIAHSLLSLHFNNNGLH